MLITMPLFLLFENSSVSNREFTWIFPSVSCVLQVIIKNFHLKDESVPLDNRVSYINTFA